MLPDSCDPQSQDARYTQYARSCTADVKHVYTQYRAQMQAPLHTHLLSRGLVGLLSEHRHFLHELLKRLHQHIISVNHHDTDRDVEKNDAQKTTTERTDHTHESAVTKVRGGEGERDKGGLCRISEIGEGGGGGGVKRKGEL